MQRFEHVYEMRRWFAENKRAVELRRLSKRTPVRADRAAVDIFCARDASAVIAYRANADLPDEATFKRYFPDAAYARCFHWLDSSRDFVFTQPGLKLLSERHLRAREPIQFAMLRFALLLAPPRPPPRSSTEAATKEAREGEKEMPPMDDDEWWELLRLLYDITSAGFLLMSSSLANADKADNAFVMRGEACRLMVANPDEVAAVGQYVALQATVSMGVGVGLGVDTVTLNGNKAGIRGGFVSLVDSLNSNTFLRTQERSSKIALYVSVHNVSVIKALRIKRENPSLENVFIGILVRDHFMRRLQEGEQGAHKGFWYLFPNELRFEYQGRPNCTLSDVTPEDYAEVYDKLVEEGRWVEAMPAADLAQELVRVLRTKGAPYVIFIDTVNRFQNTKHLGVVKTLNLCAEVTNYCDERNPSSCTLLTVNTAAFDTFPQVALRMRTFVKKQLKRLVSEDGLRQIGLTSCRTSKLYHGDHFSEFQEYCFCLGFMANYALNNMLGPERANREVGVTPTGVYDASIILKRSPVDTCWHMAHSLYCGALYGSVFYNRKFGVLCKRFEGSRFSVGEPQWAMRGLEATCLTKSPLWNTLRELMRGGMANSAVTAYAPTASTSPLCGVTESVSCPPKIIFSKENKSSISVSMLYGYMVRAIREPDFALGALDNSLDYQLGMYRVSAPFVDQSQSTTYNLDLCHEQTVFDVLRRGWEALLKTGVYYLNPTQFSSSIPTVNYSSSTRGFDCCDC